MDAALAKRADRARQEQRVGGESVCGFDRGQASNPHALDLAANSV
jgi:hypothetical protein